jgi:DinB superfamily
VQKSKPVILSELQTSFEVLYKTANLVPDGLFNTSKENKWTPAENISHLVTATKMTSLPFTLPKFVPALLYGKSNGKSRTYDEVVNTYKSKLAGGAKASGVYIPKKTNYEREKLGKQILKEGEKLVNAIDSKWTEEQLDTYRVAHPILGKLTLRELAYFTIYHNIHHTEIIRKYYL